MQRGEGAEDDVGCNPRKRQPAGPILTAQHENSTDDGHDLGECDPEAVLLQRDDLVKMVDEAHDADCDVDAGENRDGDGARTRSHGGTV